MSEIEADLNLRAGALSRGVRTQGNPIDSGRANGCINWFMRWRAMVQANERCGPLA